MVLDEIFFMKLTTFILILMNPCLTGTQIVTNARIYVLVSLIHHTVNTNCILMGNTSKHCRMGSDSDFAGDLEDSKYTIKT